MATFRVIRRKSKPAASKQGFALFSGMSWLLERSWAPAKNIYIDQTNEKVK